MLVVSYDSYNIKPHPLLQELACQLVHTCMLNMSSFMHMFMSLTLIKDKARQHNDTLKEHLDLKGSLSHEFNF